MQFAFWLIAVLILLPDIGTAAASSASDGWSLPGGHRTRVAQFRGSNATLQQAQHDTHAWVVVVVTATSSPQQQHHNNNRSSRCGQAGQHTHTRQLVAWSPAAAAVVPPAVRSVIVQAMQQLQALMPPADGRCPYPLSIDELSGEQTAPLAVLQLDASGGRLLLHTQLLLQLRSTPVQVVSTVAQSCTAAWRHLLSTTQQVLPPSMSQLVQLLPRAVAVGLAASFAAAVPRWLCFACPIVLGLLAPLIINAGAKRDSCGC
jgi:hypothetical protein